MGKLYPSESAPDGLEKRIHCALRLGLRQGGPVCNVVRDIRFPHFGFLPELNRM